jgi:multidrug efflux pump
MNITEICINRPVTAWAIFAAVVLFGAAAVFRIGISHLPDVDFPVINIQVTWQGASPESMEHDVMDVLEDSLGQVDGVSTMTSSSQLGSGNLTVELNVGKNVDNALTDIQARISQAQSLLPRDMDPAVIQKINPEDFPIMWISLSGAFSRQQLSDSTRYVLKERLQKVRGVGNIQLGGWLERNIRLWFDQSHLEQHGLTMVEVLDRLKREHLELPAGRIETPQREIDVRVLGEALNLDQLRRMIIGGREDLPVRLEDVALVEDGFADERSISRNSGIDAMAVGVTKQRGENAVAVASRVQAELAVIEHELPQGMHVAVNYDDTVFIAQSVHEVETELLLSMALTSLVCLFFLGSFAATANVVLAIPMSVLGTIAVLYWCGFTLNTFTLLALALVVGIVVDDAIMVQENISRHRDMGMPAIDAARLGTRQITFAALASSVAVIAIFLPVVFMQGIIGKFFLQFGITLCVAVGLSYLEAMTLAPARCAQFLAIGGAKQTMLGRWAEYGFSGISTRYRQVLLGALRHPWITLAMALVVFMGSIWVLTTLPAEQSPSQDQSTLLLRINAETGASIHETDRIFRRVETYLLKAPEVEREFSVVGGFGGGVDSGVMFISLKPPHSRHLTQEQFSEVLRHEFANYAGAKIVIQDLSKGGFSGGRGFPVEFSLRGEDWDQLVTASKGMMQAMRSTTAVSLTERSVFGERHALVVPARVLSDVDSDYQLGKPEVAIIPDRERAQDLGIATGDVAEALNALIGGVKVGKFTVGERRFDIRARLISEDRAVPEALDNYRIRSSNGQLVPLSSLVKVVERSVLEEITHKDHARAISIFANTGADQGQALQVVDLLAKNLPSGVTMISQGASAELQESFIQFVITFFLGILMAYLILAAQFNSFWHPVTVLVVLPLAIAGAAFALKIGHFSINTFSVIGILLLMGLVKKNSIILVDYAERIRSQGHSVAEAMLEAGMVRLRPIIMTSAATMMAAVPTAIGFGAGAEARQPMAVAVFGGVLLSTVLSLVVVPAFYIASANAIRRLRRLLRLPDAVVARPGPEDAATPQPQP